MKKNEERGARRAACSAAGSTRCARCRPGCTPASRRAPARKQDKKQKSEAGERSPGGRRARMWEKERRGGAGAAAPGRPACAAAPPAPLRLAAPAAPFYPALPTNHRRLFFFFSFSVRPPSSSLARHELARGLDKVLEQRVAVHALHRHQHRLLHLGRNHLRSVLGFSLFSGGASAGEGAGAGGRRPAARLPAKAAPGR